MITNTAFLAALTVFLLGAWLAGELTFLAPYRVALFRYYGTSIAAGAVLVFVTLFAAYYGMARWLVLRDTGRKLTHLDRQVIVSEGVHQDRPVEEWSSQR